MDALTAKRIIRRHYGLNRPVTNEELAAEVECLKRKRAAGSMDDRQERLHAALYHYLY